MEDDEGIETMCGHLRSLGKNSFLPWQPFWPFFRFTLFTAASSVSEDVGMEAATTVYKH